MHNVRFDQNFHIKLGSRYAFLLAIVYVYFRTRTYYEALIDWLSHHTEEHILAATTCLPHCTWCLYLHLDMPHHIHPHLLYQHWLSAQFLIIAYPAHISIQLNIFFFFFLPLLFSSSVSFQNLKIWQLPTKKNTHTQEKKISCLLPVFSCSLSGRFGYTSLFIQTCLSQGDIFLVHFTSSFCLLCCQKNSGTDRKDRQKCKEWSRTNK